MDKKDIIDLVKSIGLEKTATQSYKDCCSIISKTPATRANFDKIQLMERHININKIADEITQTTQVINL